MLRLAALVLIPSLCLAMPISGQTAPTIVITWNPAALAELRLGKLGPPIVARALAKAHTGMCDALTPYHARAIGAVMAAPQDIGNTAANAVIASLRSEGSNRYGDLHPAADADCTGCVPVNGPMPCRLPTTPGTCPFNISEPDHWQPLVDNGFVQSFAAPHWEIATPFALTSAGHFDGRPEVAAGPIYLQSQALYQSEIDQILNINRALTAQQDLIVKYGAHGPASELPPGHWGLPGQYVTRRDANTIDKNVKMFLFSDALTQNDGRQLHSRHRGVYWTTVSGETRERG